ncbi:SMI1/KNR4 family protein [Parasediminibacterium paludis]|uniref:SMI1/KNR4 family protein n=1 Tax=Parasediminibacterium paludis TaxID=908966 RepID=A0ABV8PTK2_9BACT
MTQLLEKLAKNFDTVSPATTSAIEAAEKFFNLRLPSDYKAFLLFSNGLEGETTDSYLVLWGAEELVELNQAYNVKEFVSNIILIGSDGAENAFGFDTTKMTIVELPFIGMGHIANEKISETFSDFLSNQIKEQNKSFFKRLFN